jgi:putative flippase GtrA
MINKLFKEQTDNALIQLFRYSFVGGMAFLVDFSSLFIFTEYFKLYYLLAAAIGFIFGLGINYVFSNYWVFKRRTLKSRWLEFFIFCSIGIVGLGLNELLMYLFTTMLYWHYLISKSVATILIYLWNFFTRKFILYK